MPPFSSNKSPDSCSQRAPQGCFAPRRWPLDLRDFASQVFSFQRATSRESTDPQLLTYSCCCCWRRAEKRKVLSLVGGTLIHKFRHLGVWRTRRRRARGSAGDFSIQNPRERKHGKTEAHLSPYKPSKWLPALLEDSESGLLVVDECGA